MKTKLKGKERAAARSNISAGRVKSGPGKAGLKQGRSNAPESCEPLSKAARAENDAASGHALSAVKRMSVMLHMRDINNHLQGLYAEVGRSVYDQQMRRQSVSKASPPHVKELFHKISPLRKKLEKLERESRALKP